MTAIEMPVFVICLRSEWLCIEVGPDLVAAPAFGTREDAQKYLEHVAKKKGVLVSMYRVLEFKFNGKVSEG